MNIRPLPFLLLMATALSASAQTNYSGINYQAVVRNAAGDPVANQAVSLRLHIQEGLITGYVETHSTTTDAQGQVSVVWGQGTPEGGSFWPTFDDVPWNGGGTKTYQVYVDITGGTNYAFLGSGQFKSVPFAMHALTSGSAAGWSLSGNDLLNTNTGNIGIGTAVPEGKLHLFGQGTFGTGTRIIFGDDYFSTENDVVTCIGEYGWESNTDSDQLDVHGEKGIHFSVGRDMDQVNNPVRTAMYVDGPTGNVGIGTTTPEASLDVASGNIRVTGTGLTAALDLTPFSPSGNDPGARIQATDDGGFGAHIDIFTKPSGAVTNPLIYRMRVQSDGNVGIGTTTPGSLLQVGSYVGAADRYITVATQGGNTQRSGIRLRHYNEDNGYTIESDERGGTLGLNILDHQGSAAGASVLFIQKGSGNVGIGTTTPQSKLAVNGKITSKEVDITVSGFPDYVFREGYELMPLGEVKRYINEHGRLPKMPSEADVLANGLSLGAMNVLLVEKVEELTLQMIASEEQMAAMRDELAALRALVTEGLKK